MTNTLNVHLDTVVSLGTPYVYDTVGGENVQFGNITEANTGNGNLTDPYVVLVIGNSTGNTTVRKVSKLGDSKLKA